MRTDVNNLSAVEIENYKNWCLKNNIIYDTTSGPDSAAATNAQFVSNYFMETWQQDMTEQNLDLAFPQLKDHLQFWSRAEAEYLRTAEALGPSQTALVTRLLKPHGLENTGDDLFSNFVAVVRFANQNGWTISKDTFQRILGNLQNTPAGTGLRFAPTPELQKHRAERDQRVNTTVKKVSAKERWEQVSHLRHLHYTPEFQALREAAIQEEAAEQAEQEAATPRQNIESGQAGEEAYWQQRTADYIRSLSSNLMRQEAESLFGKGKYANWRATYMELDSWVTRRKQGRG